MYTKVQDFVTTSTQLHTQEDSNFCYDFNTIAYTRSPLASAMTLTQQQLLQQFNNYCNKSNNSEKLIYFQVHYSKTSVLAQCLRQWAVLGCKWGGKERIQFSDYLQTLGGILYIWDI